MMPAVTVVSIAGPGPLFVGFRGVLLQARLMDNDTTPVGSFLATDPNTRRSNCTPPEVRLYVAIYVHTYKYHEKSCEASL